MSAPTIGFVPTMGFLHEGHLSLVRAALKACDRVVVSIFVNPSQFEPDEDFEQYPRDLERDRVLLEREGVDEIWIPSLEEIYPEGLEHVKRIEPPARLSQILCGVDRPHHFLGVATASKRLFEHVNPTDVYFGQKDFQQTRVIDWLIQEYFGGIRLHVEETVREPDGLAMSSRNCYLSAKERDLAVQLNQALKRVESSFERGERRVRALEEQLKLSLMDPRIDLLYGEIRAAGDLDCVDEIDRSAVVALAVQIGGVRLIDNILLNV